MKTNVNMIRKMGSFEITQRSKDGKFDASKLLKQWNKQGTKREMKRFLDSPKTKEFIKEILKQDFSDIAETRLAENQIVMFIKGRNTKNGKIPDVHWMHPYLFIKFAMYLNPRFEYQVIKFVHDQLIDFRNNAGDNYRGLTNAVQRFDNIDYPRLAKGLNWIVFDRHENGIRQTASEKQLKEMTDLQKKLAFACDMGYIKAFDELINEMRRIYISKH